MTTWPPSVSEQTMDDDQYTTAFDLLDDRVRQWIWNTGWSELRDIQEEAIHRVLGARSDLIIAAATAAGKTEAVFLPICSELLGDRDKKGVRVLYVSPLKALINDQHRRLTDLCEGFEIAVHRWHGDVPAQHKRRLIERPSGILLITPESLEALFVVHGYRLARLFESLEWMVVDELHAFIGRDRGRQLQSLLHRIELRTRRRIRRIGLSATLGDLSLAARFLRSEEPQRVETIVSSGPGQEIHLQIRGYTLRPPPPGEDPETAPDTEQPEGMAAHLFRTLRGQDHLVFANSRAAVEATADLLRRRAERERLPNEFFPHHGSLSRELREEVEDRLKDGTRPTTAICTSTLELGIDIGRVASIAQIGAPFSVSSLRQRLGRSGRRGEPAVLRFYISEPSLTARSHWLDQLRTELVQAIAMVELLIERWCEPMTEGALHLSVLVQQVLSLIAEHGGVSPREAWLALCRSGPFRAISSQQFGRLLRRMGDQEILTQSPDGNLLAGTKGERLIEHFTFYTIFQTPEEYRVLHQGRCLGTLTADTLLAAGMHLIFAGRRWRVQSVDPDQKCISLTPSPGGRVPTFLGSPGGQIHDRIRTKMLDVWAGGEDFPYLDSQAKKLLAEGRANYARLGLNTHRLIAAGKNNLLFLCRGDRIMNTVALQLLQQGVEVTCGGPVISLTHKTPEEARGVLAELISRGPADPIVLAEYAGNKQIGKYDWVLGKALLAEEYAAAALDPLAAHQALGELLPMYT